MQHQAATTAIANHSQIFPATSARIVQGGGVLDQQVLSRLLAGRSCALPMRRSNLFPAGLGLIKEAISRLEFGPIWKGLRQRAAGALHQVRSNVHQTISAALIAQFRQRKFHLSPVGRRQ